jgi:hypothetical protein
MLKLKLLSFVTVLLMSNLAFAQSSKPNNSSPGEALSQKELIELNRQPLLKTQGALGAEQRQLSFEHKEENGTHIREYRELGKPIDIQVQTRMGSYQMSQPTDLTPVISEKTIQRVPSIQLPF